MFKTNVDYNEKYAIKTIQKFLEGKEKNFKLISNLMFEKYIDFDDKNLLKIFRKLMIIYSRYHKKIKYIYFNLWKFKIKNFKKIKNKKNNINNDNNKSNEIIYVNKYLNVDNNSNDLIEDKNNSIQITTAVNFSIDNKNNNNKNIIKEINNKNNNSFIKRSLTPSKNLNKKKKSNLSKIEQQILFESLYNDSKTRKEKLKQLSLEKERKFNTTYTFTPDIIPNKLNKKYLYNLTHSSSNSNINNENNNNEFLNRLEKYEKIKNNNLKKIKKEYEDSIPKPNYTNNKNGNLNLIPISVNYYKEKKERLEKLKKSIINEQGITFKPKLNDNSNIKNDIYERNALMLSKKEENLNKIKEDKECTFMPKINNNSYYINKNVSIISTTNNNKNENDKNVDSESNNNNINISNCSNVGERLYNYKKKYDKNLEEIKNKFKETFPFKPIISKNTNDILENKKKLLEELKERYEIKDYSNSDDLELDIKCKVIEEIENKKNILEKNTNEFNEQRYVSIQSLSNIDGFKTSNLSTNNKINNNNNNIVNNRKCESNIISSNSLIKSTNNNTNNTNNHNYTNSNGNYSIGISDEKLLEFVNKNYINIDESLDKFKNMNNNNNKNIINKNSNISNHSTKYNSMLKYEDSNNSSLKKNNNNKKIINNLNYYDNLF